MAAKRAGPAGVRPKKPQHVTIGVVREQHMTRPISDKELLRHAWSPERSKARGSGGEWRPLAESDAQHGSARAVKDELKEHLLNFGFLNRCNVPAGKWISSARPAQGVRFSRDIAISFRKCSLLEAISFGLQAKVHAH